MCDFFAPLRLFRTSCQHGLPAHEAKPLYCEKGPLFGCDITERLQATAQSDSFSDCSERGLRTEDACPMTLARGTDPGADRDQEIFVFRACFAYNLIVARPYRTGLGLDTIPLLGSQQNVSHVSGKVGSRQPHEEGNRAVGSNSACLERRRTVRRCSSKTRRGKRIHQQPHGRTHGRPYSQPYAQEQQVVRRGSGRSYRHRAYLSEIVICYPAVREITRRHFMECHFEMRSLASTRSVRKYGGEGGILLPLAIICLDLLHVAKLRFVSN